MDKVLHFLVSFFIYMVLERLTGSVFWSTFITLLIGVIKETIDQIEYGGWSWGDLLADVIGIIVAIWI